MNNNDPIADNTSERQYFTTICNLIDDLNLSPLATALYLHYKRWSGAKSKRPPGVRFLMEKFKVSDRSIRSAKDELAAAELVIIEPYDPRTNTPEKVIILDVWERNTDHCREQIALAKMSQSKEVDSAESDLSPDDDTPVVNQRHPCRSSTTPLSLTNDTPVVNQRHNIRNKKESLKSTQSACARVREKPASEPLSSELPHENSLNQLPDLSTEKRPKGASLSANGVAAPPPAAASHNPPDYSLPPSLSMPFPRSVMSADEATGIEPSAEAQAAKEYLADAMDGIKGQLGVVIMASQKEAEWWGVADRARLNRFTVDELLETFDLVKRQTWRRGAITPAVIETNLPRLAELRLEVGVGFTASNTAPAHSPDCVECSGSGWTYFIDNEGTRRARECGGRSQ